MYIKMKVALIKSPSPKHQYRVVFADGKHVDFGGAGYSDYTLHRNPARMRAYVKRHGGVIPKYVRLERNPSEIHRLMARVDTSTKENWQMSGVRTAGFWSRWLLWSYPSMGLARKFMTHRFGIQFHEARSHRRLNK